MTDLPCQSEDLFLDLGLAGPDQEAGWRTIFYSGNLRILRCFFMFTMIFPRMLLIFTATLAGFDHAFDHPLGPHGPLGFAARLTGRRGRAAKSWAPGGGQNRGQISLKSL